MSSVDDPIYDYWRGERVTDPAMVVPAEPTDVVQLRGDGSGIVIVTSLGMVCGSVEIGEPFVGHNAIGVEIVRDSDAGTVIAAVVRDGRQGAAGAE